ncbi:apyrase-like [Trichogramma pretiosum]|uniref:apyrase-like n=1 Tax=Trichogramma pretiosum TaxID=7493 RepID=UPI000C719F15|nr:apyrase-like [Trichogramma pretiosum]
MFAKVLILIALSICSCNAFTARQLVYPGQDELFQLTIAHMNDFHARFVQTGRCNVGDEDCYGGLARLMTAVKQIKLEQSNTIYLNAGDNYQGTLWYNLFKGNATVHFMNKFPHDAMAIGNHDFDDGVSGLVYFLERFNAPVVAANIDSSEEPSMQGLYRNSTIIERSGKKIGIIGVSHEETKTLSQTGKVKFLDAARSINLEAEKLKKQGIDIIIVLSHVGLENDRKLARNCPDVDVIVGGHSHTFLYTGKPPFNNDEPADDYPVVVQQEDSKRTVLIVQAGAYTKYLGNLTVWFDSKGEVADWEGAPIYLDSSIEQDEKMLKDLKPWADIVEQHGNAVVGTSRTTLSKECLYVGDCAVANLVTDSFVHAFRKFSESPKHWTYAAIAFVNSGGVRNQLPAGNISYADAISILPFEDDLVVVELPGRKIRRIIEKGLIRNIVKGKTQVRLYSHLSGIRFSYDLIKPAKSCTTHILVQCQACDKPVYEPLDEDKIYRMILRKYLAIHPLFAEEITVPLKSFNIRGVDALTDYMKSISPFSYEADQRVTLDLECYK